jgi:hypothetical protein
MPDFRAKEEVSFLSIRGLLWATQARITRRTEDQLRKSGNFEDSLTARVRGRQLIPSTD